MGDIWPYGPPVYESFSACQNQLEVLGMDQQNAIIGAAIATAESSRDLTVINDTPATQDYSVGCWQINYYGTLYAGRAAAYGTPQELIEGGLDSQAAACLGVYRDAGDSWTPWSTYNSGAYAQYLSGGAGSTAAPGQASEPEIGEGATGAAVQLLQADLNLTGANLTVDGDFGPLTLAAVENFQRAHGLTVDGIVGPLTWAALDAAVAAVQGVQPPNENEAGTLPPDEAPPNVDPDTAAAWSNLAYQTGPYLNSLLVTMGTLTSSSPVG